MGDWTGSVPSYAAGDEVPATNMQIEAAIQTALTAAWTSWTPTLTNLTLGDGTVLATYRRLGKTVDFRFRFKLGASSAVGTGPSFTLPFTPAAAAWAASPDFDMLGVGMILDTSTTNRRPTDTILITAPNVVAINYLAAGVPAQITATVPWTWATGDTLAVSGTYYTD